MGSCSRAGPSRLPLTVMFEDFGKYVAENYAAAKKIVEVGVVHRIDVANDVKTRLPNVEVIVTDSDQACIRNHRAQSVRAVVDDVLRPRLTLYSGAGLVYSIQPPVELLPSLVRLARRVDADLLVVPIMDEQEAFQDASWRRVTRQGRTLGWLLPNRHRA
jgi:uncharacterized protein